MFDPNKVKRGYDSDVHGWTPDPEGICVRASDYDALLALYNDLKAQTLAQVNRDEQAYATEKRIRESGL